VLHTVCWSVKRFVWVTAELTVGLPFVAERAVLCVGRLSGLCGLQRN